MVEEHCRLCGICGGPWGKKDDGVIAIADSDQAERATGESEYDKRCAVPIAEAIAWAHALPYAVTLFLYDED